MAVNGKKAAGITGAVVVALAAAGAVALGLFLPAAGGSTAVVQAQTEALDTPTPIAGPTVPVGFPYSSLALLRSQRMSYDAVPAAVLANDGQTGPHAIATSARLVASHGNDRVWLAASNTGGFCVVSGTVGQNGADTGCTSGSPSDSVAAGSSLGGVGGDGYFATVVADGAPAAGVILPGYRQVAANVWLKASSAWKSPTRPTVGVDPSAFPLTKPFSSFAILRRTVAATDALPKTPDDASSITDDVIRSTVRLVGTVSGTTVWVGVNTEGAACLITAGAGGTGSVTCGDPRRGTGVATGDDHGTLELDNDHDAGRTLPAGSHRLGTNVVVSPAS